MNPAIDRLVPVPSRLPAWALGLSLAVHLAVLAGPFVQRQVTEVDLPPLVVNFRLPPASAPVTAERTSERMFEPSPAVRPQQVNNSAPPTRLPAPAVLAVSRPVTPSEAPDVPAAAPALAPAAERSDVAPPARTVEATPAADSADTAAMARYVRLLGELLAQQQQYPRLAALRGWEGEVRLRLQVARKGTIVAVQVVRSSGFDVLDQHAVQLVQSTSLPAPPAAYFLNSSANGASPDLLIDIPIHYTLKKHA